MRRLPSPRRLLAPTACLAVLLLLAAPGAGAATHVDLLAMGDWGTDSSAQRAVAASMKSYLERNRIKPDAVLLLGDNFYVDLRDVNDPRWKTLFETMYDPKSLDAPFYAVLGNHDHEDGKDQIQLDYSKKHPASRFRLPALWYRVDLPRSDPLVTLIALDSNPGKLGEKNWAAQNRWLESELSRPRASLWTICFAHHPLFSDSAHGDDAMLQEAWGPLLKKHAVDFYLAGHDHALEHLQLPGWPVTFLVSGGGGKETYEIEGRRRATFARSAHGFLHLRLDEEKVRATFVDENGKVLYSFERDRAGSVRPVETSAGAAPAAP